MIYNELKYKKPRYKSGKWCEKSQAISEEN